MKNLAIIPARGGSKRIPRKNVKFFMGKPIIAFSIENAIKTNLFDDVMVSTDDAEIEKIALRYGASVPFLRSAETANDFATLADVIREVISLYEKRGQYFDNVCCILATCPLIGPENILNAYEKLVHSEFITVYPVVPFSYPILRSLKMDEQGGVSWNWPEYSNTRSQDIVPFYHDSGSFYWHKLDLWLSGQRKGGGIVIGEELVQDIDTEQDWKLAEMKYRIIHGKL